MYIALSPCTQESYICLGNLHTGKWQGHGFGIDASYAIQSRSDRGVWIRVKTKLMSAEYVTRADVNEALIVTKMKTGPYHNNQHWARLKGGGRFYIKTRKPRLPQLDG